MMVEPIWKTPKVEKPVKRTRIRTMSAKNAASERVYATNRALRLTLNPVCQRCTWRRAVITHHILPRTPKNSDHSLDNLLACCQECHDEIHLAPVDAYREGWLRRRNPKPGDAHYVAVGE